jgi:dihydroceramidase
MQIATACCLHRAMAFGKSKGYSRNVALVLIISISIETVYHSVMDEHVVHELTFLLLILLVVRQTRSLINKRVERREDKQMLKWLAIFGTGKSSPQDPVCLSKGDDIADCSFSTGCFLTGYLLWQLDFIFCPQLTAWKRAVGMPWGFLLEFHGWWHVLTAIGAYVFMVMVDSLTQDTVRLSGGPFAWLNGQDGAKVKPR